MAQVPDTADRLKSHNDPNGGKSQQENAGAALGRINSPDRSHIERQARFQALQLASAHNEPAEQAVARAKAYLAFLMAEASA